MKVLMLGWELPPHISGGLGIASEGIAEGLASCGHKVDFLLPKKKKAHRSSTFKILDASKIKPDLDFWRKKTPKVETLQQTEMGLRMIPYLPAEVFEIAREKQIIIEKLEDTTESQLLENVTLTGTYQDSLLNETSKYALLSTQLARKNKYDLVHAHDWVTFKAGRMAAKEAGLPLYVHCHSTEYDRNGQYTQAMVIEEERLGFEAAKKIFCVSQKLKDTIIEKFQVDGKKIVVVPNATNVTPGKFSQSKIKKKVLFIGRFTHQKSPYSFIDIARDLINRGIDCDFEMIGDGYLRSDLENKVAQKNLTKELTFRGFISQSEVLKSLQKADLLIVPSASEPFGLVTLEAVASKVAVAAAHGSGIAEFIPSLPQVNLWDHYNFVRLAERLLTENKFRSDIIEKCFKEANDLSWTHSASIIQKNYAS